MQKLLCLDGWVGTGYRAGTIGGGLQVRERGQKKLSGERTFPSQNKERQSGSFFQEIGGKCTELLGGAEEGSVFQRQNQLGGYERIERGENEQMWES